MIRGFAETKPSKYSPLRLHPEAWTVEPAMQTHKNLIIANLEDKIGFTESINWALRVMRITMHTGLKVSPFELHHGRKSATERTYKVIGKSYLSD